MTTLRTDENNNPTAFTTDIALQARLVLHVDYEDGTRFSMPSNLHTARLLGDPIAVTIRMLDRLGFYTALGQPRWRYIAIPHFLWLALSEQTKANVIGFMYQREGGTAMRHLFPRYGAA
jgi:hypothetical protein